LIVDHVAVVNHLSKILNRSSKKAMRSIASCLIYAAVLVRAAGWFEENPPARGIVIALLAAYGIAMASEPWLTRRLSRYPGFYLPLQSILVLTLLIEAPGMDFLTMLFLPLSFQAVQFFKRRAGFLWIGAFTLAVTGPLLIGWEWELPGLAMVLFYGGLNFIMGSSAHLAHRAIQARQENQRLLTEMAKAYRQLQEYAAQVEEWASAQERSRLARELHDSVTQTLFSMNLTVQAAQMLAAQNPGRLTSPQLGWGTDKQAPDIASPLDRLQELAHSAAGEIQVLVIQLQPPRRLGERLDGALRRLAEERRQRDGLQIDLEMSGAARANELPERVTAGLYRIAQEALNNVAKHAGSCQAVVRLNLESRPAFLAIEDTGAGFDPGKVSHSIEHLGLPGMTERAREIGWKLIVDSQTGRGTRIRAEENRDAASEQV
jgi:signal transduction histidine kinase